MQLEGNFHVLNKRKKIELIMEAAKQDFDSFNIENIKNIPIEMQGFHNWVNWIIGERDGKPTKIPINPKIGEYAKSNDPSTWGTFEQAKTKFLQCENEYIKGVGFLLTKTPYTIIDIDHTRNKDTEIINQETWGIIQSFQSYTEVTPSGEGIRIIIRGELPKGHRCKNGGPNKNIEVYSTDRFITVTGNVLDRSLSKIEYRQRELNDFYSKYFPKEDHSTVGKPRIEKPESLQNEALNPLTDEEVILMASKAKNGEKFKKLFDGDWTDYPSQSEADQALSNMLAFWTDKNKEQMDRLFNQSLLMREKWDSKRGGSTYGAITMSKAINGTRETFKPEQFESEPISDDITDNSKSTNKNLLSDLRIWLDNCYGTFTLSQIYIDLEAKTKNEKGNIRKELFRQVDKGNIERLNKQGEFRKIEPIEKMIPLKIKPIPLTLKFPCGIEEFLEIYRGNIIVIGGAPNSGKTAYALNLAKLNMNRFPVRYISSEMREEELYIRMSKFNQNCVDEMFEKITFIPCTSNFQDAIDINAINIVDYMEIPEGEFFKVQDQIRKIYDKIGSNDGIAIICLQKNKGAPLPRGGTGTIEKARLALTIENNTITIIKGKLWKDRPRHGLWRHFFLPGGINFRFDEWQEDPTGASAN